MIRLGNWKQYSKITPKIAITNTFVVAFCCPSNGVHHNDLEVHAEIFAALQNSNDDLWKGKREIKESLAELELFNIRQPFPLLLACYNKFSEDDFAKICKICSIISFRYSVISGLKSNVLEWVYNDAAIKVTNGESRTPSNVFDDLKSIYPSDEIFQNSFAIVDINTKRKNKLVRYILYKIENHISEMSYNYIDDNGTVEHILPENPGSDWNNMFIKDIQNEFIYRLGNYTILEERLNKNCDRKLIEDKRKIYKESKYQLSNSFDYEKWDPQNIKSRQTKLAKYAKSIWRISQSSN